VDGIHIGDFGRTDDAAHLQVTLGAGAGTDADGLIREMDMHGIDVRLGIDGDGFDIKLLAGANDTKGDFTTIGDEYFFEHRESEGLGA
jgi:hypothetical protein